MRTQIIIVMGLGILALIAGLFAHLALTDIYHLEADVTAEWMVVQIAALVLLAFIGSALVTLGRSLKILKDCS